MNQQEHKQNNEQDMILYTELCYSVALALTRDPEEAKNLALCTLNSTWHLHDRPESRNEIKMKLLTALRARYLTYHCNSKPQDAVGAVCAF